ncbi:hypothetical protein O181_080641 [Austropuccinia psidii MF-1]|uniref:Uncharacterized protein n=1 Tax=Austropuccinia psidii MF-1 TaxID=1389203 RepID=A0A9Q3IF53_9BASI|nr:hypothetical protein [Austropuccinia psidii MF-1]
MSGHLDHTSLAGPVSQSNAPKTCDPEREPTLVDRWPQVRIGWQEIRIQGTSPSTTSPPAPRHLDRLDEAAHSSKESISPSMLDQLAELATSQKMHLHRPSTDGLSSRVDTRHSTLAMENVLAFEVVV